MPEILAESVSGSLSRLRAEILLNLSGRVLNRRSGALYGSLSVRQIVNRDGLAIEVSAGGTSAPYAAVHEYGGRAGRRGASVIPRRPYILPALENETARLFSELADGISEALIYGRAR